MIYSLTTKQKKFLQNVITKEPYSNYSMMIDDILDKGYYTDSYRISLNHCSTLYNLKKHENTVNK
jgi:hypothetical protein